jgi:hypothetical protein
MVFLVLKVPQVHRVFKDLREFRDQQGLPVQQEFLERVVHRERRGRQEDQARKVQLVFKDQQGLPVQQEFQAQMVYQERRDQQVQQVQLVLKDLVVLQARKVVWDHKAQQETERLGHQL